MRCVWTGQPLMQGRYDLDHLIPVSTVPINELWNLVPSDPTFNQHVKRARMPSEDWRPELPRRLEETYQLYGRSAALQDALRQGSSLRFTVDQGSSVSRLAEAVTAMIYAVAEARSTPKFGRFT